MRSLSSQRQLAAHEGATACMISMVVRLMHRGKIGWLQPQLTRDFCPRPLSACSAQFSRIIEDDKPAHPAAPSLLPSPSPPPVTRMHEVRCRASAAKHSQLRIVSGPVRHYVDKSHTPSDCISQQLHQDQGCLKLGVAGLSVVLWPGEGQ